MKSFPPNIFAVVFFLYSIQICGWTRQSFDGNKNDTFSCFFRFDATFKVLNNHIPKLQSLTFFGHFPNAQNKQRNLLFLPNDESCDLHNVNTSDTYPCGFDCYQELDPFGDGTNRNSCGESCGLNLSFADNSTGRCEFQSCNSRIANTSHAYRCGTSDCYQKLSNGGTGSGRLAFSCTPTCDHALSMEDDSTGMCVYLDCASRTPVVDNSGSPVWYPCGTEDCYQRPDGTCSDSLCSSLTACAEQPGCKTNTNASILEKCVPDPCFKRTTAKECRDSRPGSDVCVWVDHRCEIYQECTNSQEIINSTIVCRDGCYKNAMGSVVKCQPDPCALNSEESECAQRSVLLSGYKCLESLGNCRAVDACDTGDPLVCAENCIVDRKGVCVPDMCAAIDSKTVCSRSSVCAYLNGSCGPNACAVDYPDVERCTHGCEMDSALRQCVPDECVKRYWPGTGCAGDGSDICAVGQTVWGETCVNDPDSTHKDKDSKFPYWAIIVGLVVVTAICFVVFLVALVVWKSKKDKKINMKIQDVEFSEIRMRDCDTIDADADCDADAEADRVRSNRTGFDDSNDTDAPLGLDEW